MPYEMSVHAQDPTLGRVGVVLEALANASHQGGDYEFADVAVAYASRKGVQLLDDKLSSPIWLGAKKRFLVSIDFGFTQPSALTFLSELPNAEVRIPNARAVLASPTLRPPSAFHAKTFAFRRESWHELRALVVGSANLTASALTTGSEVVTSQVWIGPSPTPAWHHLLKAKPVLDWFQDAWDAAIPVSEVLEEYRARHRKLPRPRLPEEKTLSTRLYVASSAQNEINGALPVQLAAAKALWVDASSVIKNRGKTRPGSQLNTPIGTRVFFGFDPEKVPKNTVLGDVNIRVIGKSFTDRSIRVGDNGMDVVNLPIPEQNGIETYLGTHLIFTREPTGADGIDRFTLTVTDAAGVESMKSTAANTVDLAMHGGRQYGLLF